MSSFHFRVKSWTLFYMCFTFHSVYAFSISHWYCTFYRGPVLLESFGTGESILLKLILTYFRTNWVMMLQGQLKMLVHFHFQMPLARLLLHFKWQMRLKFNTVEKNGQPSAFKQLLEDSWYFLHHFFLSPICLYVPDMLFCWSLFLLKIYRLEDFQLKVFYFSSP